MLLAVAGHVSSGKSTAVDFAFHILTELYKQSAQVVDFAGSIKDMLRVMLGVSRYELEELKMSGEVILPSSNSLPPVTVRRLLQTLGTDWGRKMIHPDIWVEMCNNRITDIWAKSPNTHILIPDLRFPNEAAMVKKLKGHILYMTRPGLDNKHTDHESEQYADFMLKSANYRLNNDKSKYELWESCKQLIDTMLTLPSEVESKIASQ